MTTEPDEPTAPPIRSIAAAAIYAGAMAKAVRIAIGAVRDAEHGPPRQRLDELRDAIENEIKSISTTGFSDADYVAGVRAALFTVAEAFADH